jgi:hypothetical protein
LDPSKKGVASTGSDLLLEPSYPQVQQSVAVHSAAAQAAAAVVGTDPKALAARSITAGAAITISAKQPKTSDPVLSADQSAVQRSKEQHKSRKTLAHGDICG